MESRAERGKEECFSDSARMWPLLQACQIGNSVWLVSISSPDKASRALASCELCPQALKERVRNALRYCTNLGSYYINAKVHLDTSWRAA